MRALLLLLIAACTSTAPVAITSLASVPHARPIPGRVAGALRVMSYNVNFGIAGDTAALAAIEQADPQVVFLQETNDVWRDVLVAGLPAYKHHRFIASPLIAGGMGVMSMYPIVSSEELPSVGGWFVAQRVVIDAPRGRVQVLNVHLRPPMSDGGSWIAGYFTTREIREREMSWHASRLDPELPTLIVGDFNEEGGDGLALAVAERLGYTDAIAQWLGKTRTWEWPVGALTLRFQLDHILHDARFTAAAAGIVEAGGSDHKPIWADVEPVEP